MSAPTDRRITGDSDDRDEAETVMRELAQLQKDRPDVFRQLLALLSALNFREF